MLDNIENTGNNTSTDTTRFSESKGTGVFSSLIFMVIAFIVMLVIAHYIN